MGQAEKQTTDNLKNNKMYEGWRLYRHLNGTWYQGKILMAMIKGSHPKRMLNITGQAKLGEIGESDNLGFRPLEITADMVGQKVAQFIAVEVKTKAYKKATKEQIIFLRGVKFNGGVGLVCSEWDNEDGYIIEDVDDYCGRMGL